MLCTAIVLYVQCNTTHYSAFNCACFTCVLLQIFAITYTRCNPCCRKSYATAQRSALALLMLVAVLLFIHPMLTGGALKQREHILHLRGLTEIFPSPRKIRMKQIGRKFTSLVVPSNFCVVDFKLISGSGLPCFSLLLFHATVNALRISKY